MTQLFTASDYAKISSLVFQPDYPGYKPNVVESPNGDGKLDTEKRYAHVSDKYLLPEDKKLTRDIILSHYLECAHNLAMQVAITIGVPKTFWPVRKYGALRVLEYGPTAVTNPHTDFDLFTLMCYRNLPEYFRYTNGKIASYDAIESNSLATQRAEKLNSQIHFGELLHEINPSQWLAHAHEVVPSLGPWQYSIVYFAIPDWDSVLPSGITVGKWLEERLARSRYER